MSSSGLGERAKVGVLQYDSIISSSGIGSVAPLTLNTVNNRVGINQLVPKLGLDVQNNIGVTRYSGAGAGNTPVYAGYMARGTQDVPLPVQAGDYIFTIAGRPFDGTNFTSSRAYISAKANENYTTIANGTNLVFAVTPDGSITVAEKMILSNDGNLGIGTLTPTSKLQVVGLAIHANNADAITAGLTAGAFFRTGADPDLVCVVH